MSSSGTAELAANSPAGYAAAAGDARAPDDAGRADDPAVADGGSRLAEVALIGVDGNDPTGSALSFVHHSGVTFPVGVDHTYAVTRASSTSAACPRRSW